MIPFWTFNERIYIDMNFFLFLTVNCIRNGENILYQFIKLVFEKGMCTRKKERHLILPKVYRYTLISLLFSYTNCCCCYLPSFVFSQFASSRKIARLWSLWLPLKWQNATPRSFPYYYLLISVLMNSFKMISVLM